MSRQRLPASEKPGTSKVAFLRKSGGDRWPTFYLSAEAMRLLGIPEYVDFDYDSETGEVFVSPGDLVKVTKQGGLPHGRFSFKALASLVPNGKRILLRKRGGELVGVVP